MRSKVAGSIVVLVALFGTSLVYAQAATAGEGLVPTVAPSPEPTGSPSGESGESQEETSEGGSQEEAGEEEGVAAVDPGEIHDSLPWLELSAGEDAVDNVHNGQTDGGDCTLDVRWPQKVQDSTTGEYFIYSYGNASCPGYDGVAEKTCVQIKVAGDWKRVNCAADEEVLAPCRAGTWKYRTKFTWVAYYIATAAAEEAAPRSASSGTRKVPQTGVKRTCPV